MESQHLAGMVMLGFHPSLRANGTNLSIVAPAKAGAQ
jgi:hypothetical protein